MKAHTRYLAACAALLVLSPAPADARSAGYLERYVDPTLFKCAELYKVRNDFYHSRGLCFSRPAAIRLYPSNPSTCRYDTSADLPISAREDMIIRRIVAYERTLGCPRP